MKRILTIIMVGFLIHGCGSEAPVVTDPVPVLVVPPASPVPSDTLAVTVEPPDPVDQILSTLDDRALAGQMIVVYRAHNAFLLEHGFGGVLLFKSMLADTASLRSDLDTLQAAAPIDYLVALDQEGGPVSRLDAVPGWEAGTPGAGTLATWPVDAVYGEGRRIGRRLTSLGINLNLAPVLDSAIGWDNAASWMGQRGRSFGTNDREIVPAARAFAAGCGDEGVACLAKHFPGYDVSANSDLEPAHSGADRAAVLAGATRFGAVRDVVAGVMMASIIYPVLGEEPAVLCPAAVALAREAVPDGLIMTDDLWGTALRSWQRPDLQILPTSYPDGDWARLIERAVRAGNDLLLVTYPAKAVDMQTVIADLMVHDSEIRSLVRAAVRRILREKIRLGLVAGP